MKLKEYWDNKPDNDTVYAIGCKGGAGWICYTTKKTHEADIKNAEKLLQTALFASIANRALDIVNFAYPFEENQKSIDCYYRQKDKYKGMIEHSINKAYLYIPLDKRLIINTYDMADGKIGIIIDGKDSLDMWFEQESEKSVKAVNKRADKMVTRINRLIM